MTGIILIFLSFPLLWNNERKYVKIAALLSKGRKVCVEADVRAPKIENNFKLVYASGITTNDDPLVDSDLGIEVQNSVRLVRTVEMYQWVETEHEKKDEPTTYTYERQWRGYPIDSSRFNDSYSYQNPPNMPLMSNSFQANLVKFGEYTLDRSQKDKLTNSITLKLTDDHLQTAKAASDKVFRSMNYQEIQKVGD